MLLPSECEAKMFKEKLIEFNMESFDELKNIKSPYTLKKIEKAEELIIKILSNENVGVKAKILQSFMNQNDEQIQLDNACGNWVMLYQMLVGDEYPSLLNLVISTAL